MGIEFFLLIIIFLCVVAGAVFFLGSFGAAKAGHRKEVSEPRPTHAYVEPQTSERTFGADTTEATRRSAEGDPQTEVRH